MSFETADKQATNCAEAGTEFLSLVNSLILAGAPHTEILMVCSEFEAIADDFPRNLHCDACMGIVNRLEERLSQSAGTKGTADALPILTSGCGDCHGARGKACHVHAYVRRLRRLIALESDGIMPVLKRELA